MMIGYIFKGSNSAMSIFDSILNWGQLLKEKICSCRSNFFPLRVDPILEGLCCYYKQTRIPILKKLEKHSCILILPQLFNYQKANNNIFVCKFSKNVKCKLYYIENS